MRVELGEQFGALGALHAVIWPQSCFLRLGGVERVVDGDDRLERLVVGRLMVRREGDVVLRMEVLGSNLERERAIQQVIDQRDNLTSSTNCKCSILSTLISTDLGEGVCHSRAGKSLLARQQ